MKTSEDLNLYELIMFINELAESSEREEKSDECIKRGYVIANNGDKVYL